MITMETEIEEGHGNACYRARKLALRHGENVSFYYNGDETIVTLDNAEKYLRGQMLSIIKIERESINNMETALEGRNAFLLEQEAQFKALFGEEPNIS